MDSDSPGDVVLRLPQSMYKIVDDPKGAEIVIGEDPTTVTLYECSPECDKLRVLSTEGRLEGAVLPDGEQERSIKEVLGIVGTEGFDLDGRCIHLDCNGAKGKPGLCFTRAERVAQAG